MTAVTNNAAILINGGNPIVTRQKGRQARYEQVCGMFTHELGHVLHSDFLGMQSYHRFQEMGRWFPDAPPLRNAAERNA